MQSPGLTPQNTRLFSPPQNTAQPKNQRCGRCCLCVRRLATPFSPISLGRESAISTQNATRQQQEGKQPKWGRNILSSSSSSSSFQSGKAPRPAAKPPPVPQAEGGSGAAWLTSPPPAAPQSFRAPQTQTSGGVCVYESGPLQPPPRLSLTPRRETRDGASAWTIPAAAEGGSNLAWCRGIPIRPLLPARRSFHSAPLRLQLPSGPEPLCALGGCLPIGSAACPSTPPRGEVPRLG